MLLLDFPNELLHRIILLVESQQDLQALGSAFMQLGPIIDPLIYANISIRLYNDGIRSMHNENGATPNKLQLRHARSLKITTDQPYYPRPGSKKFGPINQKKSSNLKTLLIHWYKGPLKDLKNVVALLVNVISVQWIVPDCSFIRSYGWSFPSGTACLDFTSILKIVASLPSLDTFSFNVFNPMHLFNNTRFGLGHLRSLKSLAFTSQIVGTPNFRARIIGPLILVMRNNPELEDLSLDFVGRNLLERGETLFLENLLQGVPVGQPLRLKRLSYSCLRMECPNQSRIYYSSETPNDFGIPFTRVRKSLRVHCIHHD
ncbi:hypothetical protein BT96DRAFT_118003 [Gymnopus androsaceus JB14]|uniref:Uncharacterized protein n=1 Tax=Gymnopus androsaceus JB14 TaxID=1447944 RepID=A0A6A4HEG5_9AGAR|nr:hypothetical protein BT96DRAFT_118003 [Gymnopus androsaceus JB14]